MFIAPHSFIENVIKVRFEVELNAVVVDEEGEV